MPPRHPLPPELRLVPLVPVPRLRDEVQGCGVGWEDDSSDARISTTFLVIVLDKGLVNVYLRIRETETLQADRMRSMVPTESTNPALLHLGA